MPWKCPVCGAENPDDADRCLSCGAPKVEGKEEPPSEEAVKVPTPPEVVEAHEAPTAEAEGETGALPTTSETGARPETEKEEAAEAQVKPQVTEESKKETLEEGEPVPEGARVYFKVINSPATELQGSTVPLNFDVFEKITIGRSEENVIIAPDPSVSRKHAVVYLDEQRRLVIEDLGSTNGTFIYNRDTGAFVKVKKAYLKSGDIIRLGEATVFQVIIEI